MNIDAQFKLDVKHFNVSFAPVIAKNRSEKDNYFCAVLTAREVGTDEFAKVREIMQERQLQEYNQLLADFPSTSAVIDAYWPDMPATDKAEYLRTGDCAYFKARSLQ